MATCAPSAPAGVALSSSSIWLSCATAAMGGDLDVSLWTIGEKSTPRRRVPSSTSRVPRSLSPHDRRLSVRGTLPEHVAKPGSGGAGTRLGGQGQGTRSLEPWGRQAAETGTAGRAGSREGLRQEGGRSRSTSQGEARRKARVTSRRHSEKFFAGGAGRVGSDSAAACLRGTPAGKFSKPPKPAVGPWGGNWPSCSAQLLFPGSRGGKRSKGLVPKLKSLHNSEKA